MGLEYLHIFYPQFYSLQTDKLNLPNEWNIVKKWFIDIGRYIV